MTRRNPAGLVFHQIALPRYPGLTLELRTTSEPLPVVATYIKPWPTREGRIRGAGVIPVDGRRFTHTRGAWQISTRGASCPM